MISSYQYVFESEKKNDNIKYMSNQLIFID